MVAGVVTMVSLTSCQAPPEVDVTTVEPAVEEEELAEFRDLEALGEIEVDRDVFLVDVTLPAEFAEGLTQEDLNNELTENGFRAATLNADGSVTYTMTKSLHDQILADLRESIQDSVNEVIADEPDTYTSVSFSRDVTNFTVAVNAKKFSGESPWLEFAIAFQAGIYSIFAGTSENDQTLTITYIDNVSGETLATSRLPSD